MQIDLLLGVNVIFHASVMVQMLLMNVQQDRHMRRDMNVLQLMTGQFADDKGFVMDLLEYVEDRDADIARKDGVPAVFLQNMAEQSGDGALSLGSGDADDLFPVGCKEDLSLGRNAAAVFGRVLRKDDAGTLKDEIVVVQGIHIGRAGQN